MVFPFTFKVNAQIVGKTFEKRMQDLPSGLKFTLSEGEANAASRSVQPPASADPLSDGEAVKLLGRLPAIKTDPDDRAEFAKRIGTLPAPKTGEKIAVKFPADEQRPLPDTGGAKTALEVVRYSPEGRVALAPDLNITFSHPMVAVTSQEEAARTVPVELSPQVDGRWRWLGTRTLMFDTDKRFPMATEFVARVPAGTRSVAGPTLQRDFVWRFSTPPPKALQMFPGSGQTTRRDTLMFVAFDQAIDPNSVISTITVRSGNAKIPVRLATQEEIDRDGSISYYSKQAQPSRWLAFRAITKDGQTADALPGASKITVTIEKGTPSAEGPLKTTEAQTFSFQTYGPMNFIDAKCGWRTDKDCSPFDQVMIQFSNSIDGSKFRKEMLKTEPAIEGANIYPSGNYIYIQGVKKGRTTYRITIDSSLPDVFGQALGRPVTATIRTGSADSQMYSQGGSMTVMDPTAKPAFSIYSTNHANAKVRMYRVRPQDWNAYQKFVRYLNYEDGSRPTMPGTLISDSVIPIKNIADELVETRIDLAAALDGGFGNVVLDIEPAVRRDKYDRTRIVTWVQATTIGLDAFVDNEELVGFATELATGKPLSGVELSIYPNDGVVAERSANPGETGTSFFGSVWNWISQWGSSDAETYSVGSDGSRVAMENVEPAQSKQTGANGVVRMMLSEKASDKGQNILIARRGRDIAFLPEDSDYFWRDYGTWHKKAQTDSLRWFVFDDRKMYKPKEDVSIKGYIRKQTAGKLGDIEPLGDAAAGITWTVRDPRNNEIAKGTADLNAFGAFDFKFKLPDNVNLGYANVLLSTKTPLLGENFTHQFQIQEFRRPEFEVSARVESEAPHFVGGKADLSVEAKYYSGGGLANAETNWTVTATPTTYTPPNRSEFIFGTWVPWWRGWSYYGGPSAPSTTQYFKGVTDESGKHLLKIDFESVRPPRPYSVAASASVQDVNRQTFAGRTSLLVHPADLYVGIRTPRTFVQKGATFDVETIVTDIDGKLVGGREVEIKAILKDWRFDEGSWKEVTVDEQICTVRSTDAEPSTKNIAKCGFNAKAGGRYIVTATVMDDRERFNESEFTVWVPGGKTAPNRNVEQEQVQIIPSKENYEPGDVAELLVIAPFTPAEGILTLRRDGIVKTERFSMKDSSITLKIPIDEKYLPNIHAQVDLVGRSERLPEVGTDGKTKTGTNTDKPLMRPAFATGTMNLPVSTVSRKLSVTAEPQDTTLAPGGSTKISVNVADHRGEPVANSEVAIVVVDESVLALSNYSISDPAAVFYSGRGPGVTDYHLRKDVLLANPEDVKPPPPPVGDVAYASGAGEGRALPSAAPAKMVRSEMARDAMMEAVSSEDDRAGDTPIELRQNFDALAFWSPSVRTDASGRAIIDLKLPDNLTRYRITAVSVDQGKRFGKTESNITAKKPLMVRPSAPRFMNYGDKIELPVVVQNQTDQDMAVDIGIRVSNAILAGGSGKRVLVKANSREEVRFPVSTEKAGTARFQFAVSSGKHSDAAEISLPVWTPATTEAFATYGSTDANGAIFQPVQTPGDVWKEFGGLEVTTSSTQLQELTDAYIYLARYPYACSEQISSRMISTAALRDVLTAFKAKDMPTPQEIESQFARNIQVLQSRQRNDGSFGLWKRDRERYEYPFLTIHVAHALGLAKAKGYKVPDEMLNRTKPYLKDIESKLRDQWYMSSPQVRWTISAYALYVRNLIGDRDAGKAKKLLAEATIEKINFEALGWVLSVLADDAGSIEEVEQIVRFLMNRTAETAAHANFVTNYADGGWLIMHSNRRADGVLLEALIKTIGKGSMSAASEDLVPKLVRGLLAHRKKGHWGSTQENVFILLALDKYFNTFEKVTPDFVAKVWLGGTYAGEQIFKGRSVDSNELTIPMSYLVEQGGTSNLIIDKQGPGRLYYRIGMKYAPKDLKLQPADYGFTVLRKYEAVDNVDDVKQNSDGSWTIKSGARVRVRLTMIAQARRYHVALVDNLPAGLEILNPSLAVTEAVPPDVGGNTGVLEVGATSIGRNYFWWRQYWFEHQNFRDERAEAFASLLWEGVYNYTYVARATTPGQFVVPPAKAEEMYHPETFGRTGTDIVRIE